MRFAIREEVDPDANIIVDATFDESLEGIIRVSVVATGLEIRAGPGCLNNFSASISGASAEVRLPCGGAAG
jgi:cell division GTPase FtsZ